MKIPRYRLGYWRYGGGDPAADIVRIRESVRELVKLGADLGIQAGWHNHSGDYVGRALWDTYRIIEDLDPAWIGYFYDLSHGASDTDPSEWKVHLRLALTRMKMVVAKDHTVEKTPKGWARRGCPLGEGVVDFTAAFAMLAKAGYAGPISVAVEYMTNNAVGAIARDTAFLRRHIEAAYGS
jgi:sugar phosphate isomerase/epimerase